MDNSSDFEGWQLSKLDHFLAMTNMNDVKTALSLLKSYSWDIDKAIEEYLLENLESLSTSSSASDFVVIDQDNLSNKEFTDRLTDAPEILDETQRSEILSSASLSDISSDSDDSCEVVSFNEGTFPLSYADVVKGKKGSGEKHDLKVSFVMGDSPLAADHLKQEEDN
ncbi:unnamed protein product [Thelazia callipaeda]|uniref:CUE domain-containing protein n=1 Tax=Thelazia callipaeda TaxID=103827 RepID=A0A0N5CNB2_THECL|nr:unnamed protein product [Thelazia callipaeda]